MIIREGRPKDLDQIVDVYGAGDHVAWDPFANRELARWLIVPLFKSGRFILAEDQGTGRLVGFSYVRFSSRSPWYDQGVGPYAFVEELHVQPGYQGKGVGSQLFEEALRVAEAEGFTTIYTAVNEDNPAAAHIYMKRGLRIHHRVLYLKREGSG
jgi:GNAT superfamily N-acetyltransferase